jgi:hypothetical protein
MQARMKLDWKGGVWQRNYFDRVIRDGQEFSDASRYIAENPMKWQWDHENPKMKQAVAGKIDLAQHAASVQQSFRA